MAEQFIDSVVNALKKLAPPPPKKVKFSDPLRKILPLAEENVKAATDKGGANLVSKDGHSALVEFDIKGDASTAGDRVAPASRRPARGCVPDHDHRAGSTGPGTHSCPGWRSCPG